MAELTDDQIAREREFLEGIPRFSVAAFFAPPIWGPAHGLWVSVMFYPLWLFADNCFYIAWQMRSVASIAMALIVGVVLAGITVVFARVSLPFVAHNFIQKKGWSKEKFIARERIWTVVSIVIGCIALVLATYYNLVIRPGIG